MKLSLIHRTPEDAIEHLEWIVQRLKTYPHQDRQGEFHYSYTYPVIEQEEEFYFNHDPYEDEGLNEEEDE